MQNFGSFGGLQKCFFFLLTPTHFKKRTKTKEFKMRWLNVGKNHVAVLPLPPNCRHRHVHVRNRGKG